MNFGDEPPQSELRAELRAWLAANAPDDAGLGGHREPESEADVVEARAWSRRLYDAGFVALAWPERFGGRGRPLVDQMIALEELARSGAPEHLNVIGLWMAAPTLLDHGSEEQCARYLRPMAAGDEIWCQGFSEPGAGSDLASLTTRAERRGDLYVVNGQKVWSSFAHLADFCILLARTGGPGHRGLTYFVADMHAPGVEVRPLRQLNGDVEFNEIFFDDVEVPAENVVGEEGGGWRVAITTLMHERVNLGLVFAARIELALRRLAETAPLDDPSAWERFAQLRGDALALRATAYRVVAQFLATGTSGPEGTIVKLLASNLYQRLTHFAVELQGEDALTEGPWQHQQLRSRGYSIEGGTSEILRSIVAERILELPRSR